MPGDHPDEIALPTGEPTIQVKTDDGRLFAAELIGTDPLSDLAVIKLVDASDLTPIEFADSDELNVGDTAIAIGYPLGLDRTATAGIISGLGREIQAPNGFSIDEVINPRLRKTSSKKNKGKKKR